GWRRGMTETPSTLDAWKDSADDPLARLLARAQRTGSLTQHDLVRALPRVELTGDVLEMILRRCAEAGVVVEGLDDLEEADAELDRHLGIATATATASTNGSDRKA